MIGRSPKMLNYSGLCLRVEQRLCELGELVSGQFPLTQREVIRAGETVGVYFCLHGPRSVKLTAICDFNKRTVIFYGTDGIRSESMPVSINARSMATAI